MKAKPLAILARSEATRPIQEWRRGCEAALERRSGFEFHGGDPWIAKRLFGFLAVMEAARPILPVPKLPHSVAPRRI